MTTGTTVVRWPMHLRFLSSRPRPTPPEEARWALLCQPRENRSGASGPQQSMVWDMRRRLNTAAVKMDPHSSCVQQHHQSIDVALGSAWVVAGGAPLSAWLSVGSAWLGCAGSGVEPGRALSLLAAALLWPTLPVSISYLSPTLPALPADLAQHIHTYPLPRHHRRRQHQHPQHLQQARSTPSSKPALLRPLASVQTHRSLALSRAQAGFRRYRIRL